MVKEAAHPDALFIFGAAFDAEMEDELKVTVIATGFDERQDGEPVVPGGVIGRDASAGASGEGGSAASADEDEDKDFQAIFDIFNKRK